MKQEMQAKREYARLLYFNGETQKDIAGKVGVSRNTINTWVKDNAWDSMRAARTITRKELVTKMLTQIDSKLEEGNWSPDEICKAAAAVEKLDKQTNIVTVIEVFSAYNTWLVARMQLDKELTPILVKTMNRYQDIFIAEKLSSTSIISE